MASFLWCLHMVEGNGELSGVSFVRALVPIKKAPFLRPNHLPKAPPPKIITLGIKFQHMNFRGTHSVYSSAIIAEGLSSEVKWFVYVYVLRTWQSRELYTDSWTPESFNQGTTQNLHISVYLELIHFPMANYHLCVYLFILLYLLYVKSYKNVF